MKHWFYETPCVRARQRWLFEIPVTQILLMQNALEVSHAIECGRDPTEFPVNPPVFLWYSRSRSHVTLCSQYAASYVEHVNAGNDQCFFYKYKWFL